MEFQRKNTEKKKKKHYTVTLHSSVYHPVIWHSHGTKSPGRRRPPDFNRARRPTHYRSAMVAVSVVAWLWRGPVRTMLEHPKGNKGNIQNIQNNAIKLLKLFMVICFILGTLWEPQKRVERCCNHTIVDLNGLILGRSWFPDVKGFLRIQTKGHTIILSFGQMPICKPQNCQTFPNFVSLQ